MSVEAVVVARANRAQRAVMGATGATELSAAARAVLAAVPEWWRRRVAAAGLHGEDGLDVWSAVSRADLLPTGDLTSVCPREDLYDSAAEALADAYVLGLDPAVRATQGRHYTPSPVAQSLYEGAVAALTAPVDGLIWDPAAGAGSLLLPALRDWLGGQRETRAEIVLARVQDCLGGRDLDAAAVWLGNVILAAELLPVWSSLPSRLRHPLPALLSVGDGLSAPPSPPQVTILNPPYGRVRLSEKDRKTWDHVLAGHANRYQLFLAAAADFAAPDGVVAALVPAGFLGGKYFQSLRKHLASIAPLTRLTYVSDRSGVFSTGVLQETVLAVFLRDGSVGAVKCEQINLNGTAAVSKIGDGLVPHEANLPWLLPRSAADIPLVNAASAMTHRLKSYGWKVSTGPLVWNRHKSQLSSRRRENSVKIVWAADLDGGVLHEDKARSSMRWLQLRHEADERTLVLSEPAVLVQRTTAPEQQRRLVGVALDEDALARWGGRVSVENHVNVLRCSDPNSPLTPKLLTALLDSGALDRLYRCVTGSVAVSAYELSAVPLPDLKVIGEWAALDGARLTEEIDRVYGLSL